MSETIVEKLTGGHPNSLGRTLEVVDLVENDTKKLEELYQAYFQEDEVVRLRVSNAFKRLFRAHPDWFAGWVDKFIDEVSSIDQPSTQWTLAQLCSEGIQHLSDEQIDRATEVFKRNLTKTDDWIVLNATMQVLFEFATKTDNKETVKWLAPQLEKLTKDPHKSVANRAKKLLSKLN